MTRQGAHNCQLVSESDETFGDAESWQKNVSLKVSKSWLQNYETKLAERLKSQDARIISHTVTSEDLSLSIVDTEARLKNKEALRDRLAAIVRTGNGKISELIEAETQLAQTQADIDSARSQLLVMRSRVATIDLKLAYSAEGVAASRGAFAPVTEAFRNLLRTLMQSLAGVITFIAMILPVILILGPIIWYGMPFVKRLLSKKSS